MDKSWISVCFFYKWATPCRRGAALSEFSGTARTRTIAKYKSEGLVPFSSLVWCQGGWADSAVIITEVAASVAHCSLQAAADTKATRMIRLATRAGRRNLAGWAAAPRHGPHSSHSTEAPSNSRLWAGPRGICSDSTSVPVVFTTGACGPGDTTQVELERRRTEKNLESSQVSSKPTISESLHLIGRFPCLPRHWAMPLSESESCPARP